MILQIFQNFHYIFLFAQEESNRARKKLVSISEYSYEPESGKACVHTICRYDAVLDRWNWNAHLGKDKKEIGKLRTEEVQKMEHLLKELEQRNPLMEKTTIYPRYFEPNRKESAPERRTDR